MANKKNKTKIYAISILVFSLFFWFFTGVYQDTEFSDKYWFIKHKPSIHWYFRINDEDWERYEALTKQEQEKLDRYDEFVNNKLFSL
ncbi:hypothetical protein A8C32_03730 [Flavivirga aquatica]|uniref:Uncharacterized protein n=1 Tax=Flavivirga aquatica TaxID=1849968 RepID=A0A1E5TB37_9FLAO|nr:hypothetical protein [Flavivirga aquatica]OEK08571.1 hypothetical protein A8C32_03730 [Flavivirga aquatica]